MKNFQIAKFNLKIIPETELNLPAYMGSTLRGGFIGKITYKGDFTEFLPYLHLGEHIHVGKNCSFGLGKYETKFKI